MFRCCLVIILFLGEVQNLSARGVRMFALVDFHGQRIWATSSTLSCVYTGHLHLQPLMFESRTLTFSSSTFSVTFFSNRFQFVPLSAPCNLFTAYTTTSFRHLVR
ncbi:hypothetical protein BD779DRAFT_1506698 [Infundibulicybe gibba]|nr:hypothetical protein BD779DRAFT_1506698 [Infundibulicybe gibba]